jgi:mannan endo-1,4-beta-mannosidase
MQSWISEMCQHVKAVAPRHLVGIGYEGFYGPESGRTQLNPGLGSDWASKEGQDFVRNAADPCIDYVRRALGACACVLCRRHRLARGGV